MSQDATDANSAVPANGNTDLTAQNSPAEEGEAEGKKKEGGFFSQNAGLLMLGMLALLAFVFAGPLIGLLALAGGGLFAWSNGMLDNVVDGAKKTFGMEEESKGKGAEIEKPQKYLGVSTELDADDKTKAKATIDGRVYDVEMKFEAGKPNVKEITYMPEGTTERKTVVLDKAVQVGSFSETEDGKQMVIDQKMVNDAVSAAIAKQTRAAGKEAREDTKSNLHVVDKDNGTYFATAGDGRVGFIVQANEDKTGFQLKNMNGEVLAEKEGLSPDVFQPKGAGSLMREVSTAVLGVASNPANASKLSGMDAASKYMPIDAAEAIQVPTPTSAEAEGAKFSLRRGNIREEATYTINASDVSDADGTVKLKGVTIEQGGRSYRHEFKKPVEIGDLSASGSDVTFVAKQGALEGALKEAIDAEDKKIAGYEKNLLIAASQSKPGEGKILYRSEDSAYIVKPNDDLLGFSITDLNGNVVTKKDGELAEQSFSQRVSTSTMIKEVLHMIKTDIGASDKPAAAKAGYKDFALAPAGDSQGIDGAADPVRGYVPGQSPKVQNPNAVNVANIG